VVVIASPDGRVVAEADGVCDGLIGFERKGTGGFGYDPLFVVPQFGRTMAELPAETKHSISHRGEALRRLRDPLTRALGAVR
jgi:XTP/dITP diphosphohydrolase